MTPDIDVAADDQSGQAQPFKRYVLFGFHGYYPGGGLNDVIGSFDTLDEAKQRMSEKDCDYYHALDMQTGTIVPDI